MTELDAWSEVAVRGPEDVRRARELAAGLAGWPKSVRADVELVVTELATNGYLHGEQPVTVRVAQTGDRVRVEVADHGRALPIRHHGTARGMTGRGFGLVATLAEAWGVEGLPQGGKVVWAELSRAGGTAEGVDTEPDLDAEALLAGWPEDGEQRFTLELGAVPTQLLVAAKAHIDDVVREVTLVRAEGPGRLVTPATSALIRAATEEFAEGRTQVRQQAQAAAARREATTQLRLVLPVSAADAAERYLAALEETDRQARASRMLTLAAPRSFAVFRRWYLRAVSDQLRALAAGGEPPPPTPFAQVLAGEVDVLDALTEAQSRLELLQSVTAGLLDARTFPEMAGVVTRAATAHEGVEDAVVYAVTDRASIELLASAADEPIDPRYLEIPLDADLPGPEVVRTAEAMHLRSLAELVDRFPAMGEQPRGVAERSLHFVPLLAEGTVVGLLGLTFPGGEITDAAQVSFVHAIADTLCQALERAFAAQRAEAERFALELAVGAGRIATFDWDLRHDKLVWHPQLLELFGQPSSGTPEVLPIEVFYDLLHPMDRQRVIECNERAIAECGEYEAEYRVLLPDGRERWITARGRVIAGADGQAERFVGAAQDTTERREGEARVARIMDSMATAFFFVDPEWRFSFVNAEAEHVLGRRREELLGRSLWDEFPAAIGTPFETQYRYAAESGEPVAFDAYYPAPLNAWFEVRAWPNPDGLAVYFIDVTDRRAAAASAQRAIERAGLLGRVSEELAGAVEPEDAVARLLSLVVPALGTWCAITLIDDDRRGGTRSGLGYARGWHVDPDLRDLTDHYARIRLGVMSDDALVIRAVETATVQLINENTLDQLTDMFPPDSEPIRILRELDTQAVAVLPLPGHESAVGMLSVFADSRHGPFSDDQVDLLREVAARAGLVLDRARLYRQQQAVAETLQRSLLRVPAPQSGVEVAVRYVPAAEVAQVGGDWYDALARPDGSAVLVIGDVMGHDVLAAAVMSETRALVRTLAASSGGNPAAVLQEVERVMGVLRLDALATVVVAQLEPEDGGVRRLRFSNAGHPPPLVIGPDGDVRILGGDRSDPLLGMPWPGRTEEVVDLAPGSTVVLYTDGLVERRGQSVEVGLSRVVELLRAVGNASPEALCDKLLAAMNRERPEDDIALLVARLSD